jgi:hypothetical protein
LAESLTTYHWIRAALCGITADFLGLPYYCPRRWGPDANNNHKNKHKVAKSFVEIEAIMRPRINNERNIWHLTDMPAEREDLSPHKRKMRVWQSRR